MSKERSTAYKSPEGPRSSSMCSAPGGVTVTFHRIKVKEPDNCVVESEYNGGSS